MNFDAIVIGTGGVGSAALYHLAKRGLKVAGLDRFPPGHDRGSSHGQTRIIRQAYFEHEDYVPLLKRAYELWAVLEQELEQNLFHEVGLLEVGPPDGDLIRGVLRSAEVHNLPVRQIHQDEFAQQFRGFVLPEGQVALYEENAGYLLVESCVVGHAAIAEKMGAALISGETVVQWQADGSGFAVQTDSSTYRSDYLVVAGGAWAASLLRDLDLKLTVLKKHLHWFDCDPCYRPENGCPTFLYETPDGYFYGFPQIDDAGLKIAEHSGGEVVVDPLNVDRGIDANDLHRVKTFLERNLPGVHPIDRRHEICFYAMSQNGNFIVDQYPGNDRMAFAAGLSGHGFKFTAVLGEILADLVCDGQTKMPADFLRLNET